MKTIVLAGQFLDLSGYAWAGRSYLKLFKKYFDIDHLYFVNCSLEDHTKNLTVEEETKLKVRHGISDIDFTPFEDLSKLTGEVYYFECLLPSTYLADVVNKNLNPITILDQNESIDLKKISMAAWETKAFSSLFCEGISFADFDAIIVHTEHGSKDIQSQLKMPVYVNHYPVLESHSPTSKGTPSDKFNILSFSSWNPRKGWKQLLLAYYSEFYDNDDVVLTIKTHGDQQDIVAAITMAKDENTRFILEATDDLPKVSFVPPKCKVNLDMSILSEEQVENYYSNFDLYASATKGEGFGLTIAQAGISGLPLLVPNQGGHLDFCPECTYKVESYTAPITGGLSRQYYDNVLMHLYQCDHESLKKKLREAYNDWKQGSLAVKGDKTQEHIINFLSSEKSIDKIKTIIKELK